MYGSYPYGSQPYGGSTTGTAAQPTFPLVAAGGSVGVAEPLTIAAPLSLHLVSATGVGLAEPVRVAMGFPMIPATGAGSVLAVAIRSGSSFSLVSATSGAPGAALALVGVFTLSPASGIGVAPATASNASSRTTDIQRYLSLVTSEHADKPKFLAWLSANLSVLDDVVSTTNGMVSDFDIDQAVGAQLDILGEIVGVSRILDFQPSGGVSPILDDDTFRLVLHARIAANQWDGTTAQLMANWQTLFPLVTLIVTDNQDMTMTALIIGLSSSIERDLIANGYIVPKPEGVGINYAFPAGKVFSYGLDNDAFGGYYDSDWISYA